MKYLSTLAIVTVSIMVFSRCSFAISMPNLDATSIRNNTIVIHSNYNSNGSISGFIVNISGLELDTGLGINSITSLSQFQGLPFFAINAGGQIAVMISNVDHNVVNSIYISSYDSSRNFLETSYILTLMPDDWSTLQNKKFSRGILRSSRSKEIFLVSPKTLH